VKLVSCMYWLVWSGRALQVLVRWLTKEGGEQVTKLLLSGLSGAARLFINDEVTVYSL
jgi:hypothetical protein